MAEGFFRVEADRKAAIALSLSLAEPGDTVAIVGKGHENVRSSEIGACRSTTGKRPGRACRGK